MISLDSNAVIDSRFQGKGSPGDRLLQTRNLMPKDWCPPPKSPGLRCFDSSDFRGHRCFPPPRCSHYRISRLCFNLGSGTEVVKPTTGTQRSTHPCGTFDAVGTTFSPEGNLSSFWAGGRCSDGPEGSLHPSYAVTHPNEPDLASSPPPAEAVLATLTASSPESKHRLMISALALGITGFTLH